MNYYNFDRDRTETASVNLPGKWVQKHWHVVSPRPIRKIVCDNDCVPGSLYVRTFSVNNGLNTENPTRPDIVFRSPVSLDDPFFFLVYGMFLYVFTTMIKYTLNLINVRGFHATDAFVVFVFVFVFFCSSSRLCTILRSPVTIVIIKFAQLQPVRDIYTRCTVMREICHLQVGQCGNQIGAKVICAAKSTLRCCKVFECWTILYFRQNGTTLFVNTFVSDT